MSMADSKSINMLDCGCNVTKVMEENTVQHLHKRAQQTVASTTFTKSQLQTITITCVYSYTFTVTQFQPHIYICTVEYTQLHLHSHIYIAFTGLLLHCYVYSHIYKVTFARLHVHSYIYTCAFMLPQLKLQNSSNNYDCGHSNIYIYIHIDVTFISTFTLMLHSH